MGASVNNNLHVIWPCGQAAFRSPCHFQTLCYSISNQNSVSSPSSGFSREPSGRQPSTGFVATWLQSLSFSFFLWIEFPQSAASPEAEGDTTFRHVQIQGQWFVPALQWQFGQRRECWCFLFGPLTGSTLPCERHQSKPWLELMF